MQQIENKFIDVKHSELLKEFITFYLSQYGEVKVNEISKKIHTSKTVQKFLLEAKRIRQPLGTDDYLAAVHAILYFSFAKAETISLATIILLCKWENEVGTPLDIASNRYLNTMFFRILDKCDKYKVNLSDNQTFFGQFYNNMGDTDNLLCFPMYFLSVL